MLGSGDINNISRPFFNKKIDTKDILITKNKTLNECRYDCELDDDCIAINYSPAKDIDINNTYLTCNRITGKKNGNKTILTKNFNNNITIFNNLNLNNEENIKDSVNVKRYTSLNDCKKYLEDNEHYNLAVFDNKTNVCKMTQLSEADNNNVEMKWKNKKKKKNNKLDISMIPNNVVKYNDVIKLKAIVTKWEDHDGYLVPCILDNLKDMNKECGTDVTITTSNSDKEYIKNAQLKNWVIEQSEDITARRYGPGANNSPSEKKTYVRFGDIISLFTFYPINSKVNKEIKKYLSPCGFGDPKKCGVNVSLRPEYPYFMWQPGSNLRQWKIVGKDESQNGEYVKYNDTIRFKSMASRWAGSDDYLSLCGSSVQNDNCGIGVTLISNKNYKRWGKDSKLRDWLIQFGNKKENKIPLTIESYPPISLNFCENGINETIIPVERYDADPKLLKIRKRCNNVEKGNWNSCRWMDANLCIKDANSNMDGYSIKEACNNKGEKLVTPIKLLMSKKNNNKEKLEKLGFKINGNFDDNNYLMEANLCQTEDITKANSCVLAPRCQMPMVNRGKVSLLVKKPLDPKLESIKGADYDDEYVWIYPNLCCIHPEKEEESNVEFKFCANENETCFTNQSPKYNNLIKYCSRVMPEKCKYREVGGNITCDNVRFGDPSQVSEKRCYYAPSNFAYVADQDGVFEVPKDSIVKYCTNDGICTYKQVSGKLQCNSDFFTDPAPGRPNKKCYQLFRRNEYKDCGFENSICNVPAKSLVKYCTLHNPKICNYKELTGEIKCNNETFGNPQLGAKKRCSYINPTEFKFGAHENNIFKVPKKSIVKYGANGKYVYKRMSGKIDCNNITFGDPQLDGKKKCYFAPDGYDPPSAKGKEYKYLGCFKDNRNHVLNAKKTEASNMDVQKCSDFCKDYKYFALQNSDKCFCGDTDPTILGQGDCSAQCSGNPDEICGNIWSNSTYINKPKHIGCFRDDNIRTLPDKKIVRGDMNLFTCYDNCKDYKYFGLQNGNECYCGNKRPQIGYADNCDMNCSGDRNETCGGKWANSVYENPVYIKSQGQFRVKDELADKFIWNNYGSNADYEFSVWGPNADKVNTFSLGDFAQDQQGIPYNEFLEVGDQTPHFKPPTDFKLIWSDRGSTSSHDYSTWRPYIDDVDYKCIGDVGQKGYLKPNVNNYRCVHKNCVEESTIGDKIWDSRGSGAVNRYSAWNIKGTNMFTGTNLAEKPFHKVYKIKESCKDLNLYPPKEKNQDTIYTVNDPEHVELILLAPEKEKMGTEIRYGDLIIMEVIDPENKSLGYVIPCEGKYYDHNIGCGVEVAVSKSIKFRWLFESYNNKHVNGDHVKYDEYLMVRGFSNKIGFDRYLSPCGRNKNPNCGYDITLRSDSSYDTFQYEFNGKSYLRRWHVEKSLHSIENHKHIIYGDRINLKGLFRINKYKFVEGYLAVCGAISCGYNLSMTPEKMTIQIAKQIAKKQSKSVINNVETEKMLKNPYRKNADRNYKFVKCADQNQFCQVPFDGIAGYCYNFDKTKDDICNYKEISDKEILCNDEKFNKLLPNKTTPKACYRLKTDWKYCAEENKECNLDRSYGHIIKYCADNGSTVKCNYKKIPEGYFNIKCSTDNFGEPFPGRNLKKKCYKTRMIKNKYQDTPQSFNIGEMKKKCVIM